MTWLDRPFVPPVELVDQAYGLCFDAYGQVLLVCSYDADATTPYWNLPGGGVEPGESLEECLVREVAEEGCARVLGRRYLGCQRVDELVSPAVTRSCYQVRFWARVELDPWCPEHETFERRLVLPEAFRATLAWGSALTAGVILEEGLRLERHASVPGPARP
ncbi:MAG: NUDIX hydrolase [Acidimicrobiales bacterium]